jgi:phosphopantothenate-cysteine ligase|tara:strand:- start:2947 stop:5181 length:2235 start_codon:yes stop_codon:yes gene_type:complete
MRAVARARAGYQRPKTRLGPKTWESRHARTRVTRTNAAAKRVEAEVVPTLSPGVLYVPEFIGEPAQFEANLEIKATALRQFVEELEEGSIVAPTAEAIDAAEWIRQALVQLIEERGKLQPAQSKVLLGDVVENLCTLATEDCAEAFSALQAICYRNASACWKVGNGHNMFQYFRNMCTTGVDEKVRCSALFLASTLVAFNEDLHRVVAKSRLTPVLLQLMQNRCQSKEMCTQMWRDVRGLTECDHGMIFLRNLSQTPAQVKLLTTHGAVDFAGSILETTSGLSRINAAIVIANLIGREDNDERLSKDDSIMEELVDLFKTACDGESYANIKHTVWKYTQGIANLATMEAAKPRLANAGVIKLLVRVLREKQHQWDRGSFWAASALWNLAFDEDVKAKILEEPGVIEALEEVRRLCSENTKMKARGALWMLQPQSDEEGAEETSMGLSEEDMQKLGAIENAKAQVMLSYEWHHQSTVLQLKEELNARGFNVWMDVDRMMGSTLEAMAAAIESSDAIIMCISSRYKESQACRTEAEYAYTKKKCLIPVKVEKSYEPDGWLGILVGSKLYYNVHNQEMMAASIPSLITAVEAIHNDVQAPALRQKNGVTALSPDSSSSSSAVAASPPPQVRNGSVSSSQEVSVPVDNDAMDRWLSAIGLEAYVHAFRHNHIYGKILLKMHQELGLLSMGEQHELLQRVLGIQSYGHRLLFLTEIEALVGPLDGKLRQPVKSAQTTPKSAFARGAPKS